MAQFDVHRNKGSLKDSIPYVVVVQSSLFDRYYLRRGEPAVHLVLGDPDQTPEFRRKRRLSKIKAWLA